MKVDIERMPITGEQMCQLLAEDSEQFGTYFDFDRIMAYTSYHLQNMRDKVVYMRKLLNNTNYVPTSKDIVINHLVQNFGVSIGFFGVSGREFNKATFKTLRMAYADNPDIMEVVENHRSASLSSWTVGYLRQYRSLPMTDLTNNDGHILVRAVPRWEVLSTSRISAAEPSLQNLPRDYKDIMSCPKGYTMVFSDTGQVEPRITYSAYIIDPLIRRLITDYDDAYYGLLHFIQLSYEQQDYYRNHLDEISMFEITPTLKDQRSLLKLMGLAGNYGSGNLATIDPVLGPLYEKNIVNHPARLEWQRSVERDVKNGRREFASYFGTVIRPESTAKHQEGDSGWYGHLVRCGINNPIQATAADLMTLSMLRARELLLNGVKGNISSYCHDEGAFCVRNEYVDELTPKLQDCQAYEVPGWIPIGSDLHVGDKEGFSALLF